MPIIIPVITIDGTSSSGKGTVCNILSNELKWNFLDSGIIYRTLALAAIYKKINTKSENSLVSLIINLNVRFVFNKHIAKIFLDGKDITDKIRNENISILASKIATFKKVRHALLFLQRSFRKLPGLIADGRDMGTVVFPDASVKIFLDASLQIRTKRRMKQLQKKGLYINFEDLLKKIKERDLRDHNREFNPLIAAKNSLILDSSKMSIEEIIKVIKNYIKKKYNYYYI
ncbi:(d)CMP kinase [Candidatus Providencia siddallii]|uniref:Cytidylate kinase n=1 Tax=Candidatus Providencia siddallii TaxID=1715285 RepID=A0ABM9NPH7_9GAMM